MWTCGICCQLAVMFAHDGLAEVGRPARTRRGPARRQAGRRRRARRSGRPGPCPAAESARPRARAASRRRGGRGDRPRRLGCGRRSGAGGTGSTAPARGPLARPSRRNVVGGRRRGRLDLARARPRRRRSRPRAATIRSDPAAGASTSTVALSVSTSTTGCPGDDRGRRPRRASGSTFAVLHRDRELRERQQRSCDEPLDGGDDGVGGRVDRRSRRGVHGIGTSSAATRSTGASR